MILGRLWPLLFYHLVDDVFGGYLPDYRHDNDMALNLTGYGIITEIRELNEYKPMRCRTGKGTVFVVGNEWIIIVCKYHCVRVRVC